MAIPKETEVADVDAACASNAKEAAVATSPTRDAERHEATEARSDALSWDDYFMSVAFLTALRSKDPSTQVGAVIVNDLNRIVGVGYNGFPSGIKDSDLPWARSSPDGELGTKYPYVVHAELNAVMNKNSESCRGCRIYTTLFCCNECAKVIIQSGISKVIYASDKHHAKATARASREMFKLAGVAMVHHAPRPHRLELVLRYPEDQQEPLPEPSRDGPASPFIRRFQLRTNMTAPAPSSENSPYECVDCESPPGPLQRSDFQRSDYFLSRQRPRARGRALSWMAFLDLTDGGEGGGASDEPLPLGVRLLALGTVALIFVNALRPRPKAF